MHLLGPLYTVLVTLLAIFAGNALVLSLLHLLHCWQRSQAPTFAAAQRPTVTVQLPLRNEAHVVRRLIDATVQLEYPRQSLEIQVLDDSTDETTALARERVAFHRARGTDVKLLRRTDRIGFKAGALAQGLRSARGEFVAVFDADFLPPPDFLDRTIPFFAGRPNLGLVQARWEHLNSSHSLLTAAQALILDGHFGVEQPARNRSGLFMNCNGSAAVWRRSCVETVGGWRYETICEDMDLSYRAQLAGWDFLYLPYVRVPAELPPQMHAFKRQQFRWAKGATQCLLRLGPELLGAPCSLPQRIEGLLHLSGYMVHPLVLALLLLSLPLLWTEAHASSIATYLSFTGLGPLLILALGQRTLRPDWPRRLLSVPMALVVGTGMAVNSAWAVAEALLGIDSPFERTPKFRVEAHADQWWDSPYALPPDRTMWIELGLACYALVSLIVAGAKGRWGAFPFLLLCTLSFAYVGGLSLWHGSVRSLMLGQGSSAAEEPIQLQRSLSAGPARHSASEPLL